MDNGEEIVVRDTEFKYGLTALNTKAIGRTVKPMVKVMTFL